MNPIGFGQTTCSLPLSKISAEDTTSRSAYVDDLLAEAVRQYDYSFGKNVIARAAAAARRQNPTFRENSDPRFRSAKVKILEKEWAAARRYASSASMISVEGSAEDIVTLSKECGLPLPDLVPLYRIACDYYFSRPEILHHGEHLFSRMNEMEGAARLAQVQIPPHICRIAYMRGLDYLDGVLEGPEMLKSDCESTKRWSKAAGVNVDEEVETLYRQGLQRIEDQRRARMPPVREIDSPSTSESRTRWSRILKILFKPF